MKQRFNISGMHCTVCAGSVEHAAYSVEGVIRADINLVSNSMFCEYDEDKTSISSIISAIEEAGFGASVPDIINRVISHKDEYTDIGLRLWISIPCIVLLMYVTMGHMVSLPLPDFIDMHIFPINYAYVQLLLSLPIAYVNRKFFYGGISSLLRKSPNMDTLVAIGSSAAYVYGIVAIFMLGIGVGSKSDEMVMRYVHNLYFESGSMILALVTVGKYLEERSKSKTNQAITMLVELMPEMANVIRGGREIMIYSEDVMIDDILVIRPGELIPVDGVLIEGITSINEATITGESMPVEKVEGSNIISASRNMFGAFKMRATKVGGDTTIARIIDLVESAGATKAPISRIADRVAAIFVPIVMVISLVSVIVWLLMGQNIEFALSIGISVLVISCPCALGLATPLAMTVAVGNSAKLGMLIKSTEALERLHEINTIVLDKTGTITEGKPYVTKVLTYAEGLVEEELIEIAASLEVRSEHPLADAIVNYIENTKLTDIDMFETVPGRGINGSIRGARYYGGNSSYMEELGISIKPCERDVYEYLVLGHSIMYFANDVELLGVILIKDIVKSSSKEAVKELQDMSMRVIMLTGDNYMSANAIKQEISIDECIAEVLPQDKDGVIAKLQSQGCKVLMVGDGINDSPALARADVGMAIGSGTQIAIESADIVLMRDDLRDVAKSIRYSKSTIMNIKQNLFWAFIYNIIGIPIAAGVLYPMWGITLSPMISAVAMSLSSIFVTLNALRLYRQCS